MSLLWRTLKTLETSKVARIWLSLAPATTSEHEPRVSNLCVYEGHETRKTLDGSDYSPLRPWPKVTGNEQAQSRVSVTRSDKSTVTAPVTL